ncbi:MAG: helix-turn-helix transcriptional regulator [Patescibacteria group bacterium]
MVQSKIIQKSPSPELEEFERELFRDPEYRKADAERYLHAQVADELITARLYKNLTQRQLAEAMGTKQSNISRAESGEALSSLSFLKKMADVYETRLLPPRFAFLWETQTVTESALRNNSGSFVLTLPSAQRAPEVLDQRDNMQVSIVYSDNNNKDSAYTSVVGSALN